MEKFIIIDGNSLINRAFYALPLLSNSAGEYSNAVYGFCNMLVKAINEHSPTYIAVAFDTKEPTFRHKLYSDYKATRMGMPEELAQQMPVLKQMLKAMKIFILEKPGIEADDIIGVISKKFKTQNIILTGDKDNLQLIDDNTSVWLTKKGLSELQKVDEEVLYKEYNLLPYQVIELKALMGDASDNIPGVSGVGEKTAMKLLEKYKDIDNLYKNIDEETGKLKERLIEQKSLAYLSRELATINTKADIKINLEDCKYTYPFTKEVWDLFIKYEFKSLLKKEEIFERFEGFGLQDFPKIVIKNILTPLDLQNFLKVANQVQSFALHLEQDRMTFAMSRFEEYHIKLQKNLLDGGMDLQQVLDNLKNLLENPKVEKILYDIKSVRQTFRRLGINLRGATFDVNLAEYLVSGSKRQNDDMEDFVNRYTYPKGAVASCLFKAKSELEKALKEQEMLELYYNIELKLVEVLYDMEVSGFKIDMEIMQELSQKHQEELKQLTQQIWTLAGEEFNINSPKQLSEILFDKLGLKAFNNKKKSTSIDVLEKLLFAHPIIEHIMRYRHIAKLSSTYLEGFKDNVDKSTHLVHTVFNQTITSTGRLSSTEPNLQNIPIRTEEGRQLRKMFISRFDKGVLVTADYSQIELRLMAHYSQDANLIKAYHEGKDIHAKTASDIFGVSLSKVTSEQRRDAKAVNFGIIYGISDYGLSQNINSSRVRAKDYIDKYFENYPGVKRFMQASVDLANKEGYVSTLMGRRRIIENINSSNFAVRQGAQRAAMNMPLQGTASDIIKVAMVKIHQKLKDLNLKAKLILQVHDELVIDCPQEEKEQVSQILKEQMESVITLDVPLVADVSWGTSWYDTK